MIIDFGTAKSLNNQFYPPGIISIYYVVFRLFHDPTTPPGSVVGIVRILAIITSLGVIVVIGLFGYHGLGQVAGLLGAAFWAIIPLFVERSRWGTAEIWVAFFSILALYCTTVTLLYRRESWSTYATYALMLAILFKYHCIFIAPFVLFAPLWRGCISKRRVLANVGRFALFSSWLLLLTPALEVLNPIDEKHLDTWVRHTKAVSSVSPLTLYYSLTDAFDWLDIRVLMPGWLGLLLIIADRSQRGKTLHALAFLGGALFLWLAGISLFDAQDAHAIRFLFAWVSLSVMLSGWGYALLLRALGRALTHYAPRYKRPGIAIALLLLCALFLPSLTKSIQNLRAHLWEDPRNFVTRYMDSTVASGRYVISKGTPKLFNRHWGGYTGETAFEIASFEEPTRHPIQTWREQDVDYAILHHFEYDQLFLADPFGYLRETTRLKGWEHQLNYRWNAMVVLRLYPIQHEATGKLGSDPPHRLRACPAMNRLSGRKAIHFHLYWQAEAATATNYQVFNHLLDAEGRLIAQIDGPPLPDPLLRRGTMDWDDPEEIIYSREYALALPEDLPPGEYYYYHWLLSARQRAAPAHANR